MKVSFLIIISAVLIPLRIVLFFSSTYLQSIKFFWRQKFESALFTFISWCRNKPDLDRDCCLTAEKTATVEVSLSPTTTTGEKKNDAQSAAGSRQRWNSDPVPRMQSVSGSGRRPAGLRGSWLLVRRLCLVMCWLLDWEPARRPSGPLLRLLLPLWSLHLHLSGWLDPLTDFVRRRLTDWLTDWLCSHQSDGLLRLFYWPIKPGFAFIRGLSQCRRERIARRQMLAQLHTHTPNSPDLELFLFPAWTFLFMRLHWSHNEKITLIL